MKKISSIILTIVLLLTFSQNVFAIQYFSDIEYNDWYYNDILALSDKELVNGYTDGTFKPNNFITRAEALKLIIPMWPAPAIFPSTTMKPSRWRCRSWRKTAC